MAAITSHDLTNKARDLSDVLSTIIALKPTFISRFAQGREATSLKHEWFNDVLKPLEIAYSAYAPLTGVFTVTSSAGWNVGDLVRVKGDSAVFRITATAATSITVEFVASNGSATDAIGDIAADANTLIFDSHPIVQNSTSGVNLFSQSGTDFNYTQIFRAEVNISNTALAVQQYGNENRMAVQMERALWTIRDHINHVALFGTRLESSAAAVPGQAGGLYDFGCPDTGGNVVDAKPSTTAAAISMKLINDATHAVLNDGGEPDMLLCGYGQARVISQFLRSQITYSPNDGTRGNSVDQLVIEGTGGIMKIVVDPALNSHDSDVWILDSKGLSINYLRGRGIRSETITTPGTDGTREMILGELTFEFKNAKQRICRIKNLLASASALT